VSPFARDEHGSMTVIVAFMASVLLGFGALAIDLSSSYGVHAKLQGAADAAALAAVQQMPDTSAATAAALDIAGKNAPSNYGTILTASDLVYGTYDPATKTFTQGGNAPNAVRLTTSRTAAKGNAPPTFLARVLDRGSGDVRTSATGLPPQALLLRLCAGSDANSAFNASGAGTFQAPNCNVQVNSWHNKAASAGNGTTVKAKSYCIVGGYNGTSRRPPTRAARRWPIRSPRSPNQPSRRRRVLRPARALHRNRQFRRGFDARTRPVLLQGRNRHSRLGREHLGNRGDLVLRRDLDAGLQRKRIGPDQRSDLGRVSRHRHLPVPLRQPQQPGDEDHRRRQLS
jgi:Flp pilus assembly protein TadG